MKYAADFRKIAREALEGKWKIEVLACLVAVLLGGADFGGPIGTGATSLAYSAAPSR